MANKTDLNNPTVWLCPVNNCRTAWRSFGLPVVLIVPQKRDPAGVPRADSGIVSARIYIEDVPTEARVAGHQNIGRRFPDRELYARTLTSIDLADRTIQPGDYTITRDGVAVDEPSDGDIIEYTTSSGVRDQIPYIASADYYDLSDILIDVELLPSDQYNLVYEVTYYKRVVSQGVDAQFLCIDTSQLAIALLKFKIDHPGRVLDEFYRLTPPPYLTNASKALDTTVDLYRPFTDVLQDIMDEQDLLEKVNWVFDAPAEAIPYLSSLLGWDIPYFPQSLDQLRRAVLRRTVEFQNLKGSRRAIVSIFRLFGFEILISNLWWSSDGKRLIRPDERLPAGYRDQEIVTESVDQFDPLLDAYDVTAFETLQIPLLYRPQQKGGIDFSALRDIGNLTLTFYAVEDGSAAHTALASVMDGIKADPAGYGATADFASDSQGFLFPEAVSTALAGKELTGYSQLLIEGDEITAAVTAGTAVPVISGGVLFNRETNELSITFNGLSQLEGLKIYGFASYERFQFLVPDALTTLQSNRFDLQVLTKDLEDFADPVVLEFAIEFLYKLKAFHSLLRVIRTRVDLNETYQVTDFCVGGDFQQRFDIDAGKLQVPPAIIPNIPAELSNCTDLDPTNLGYKDSDLLLRARVLAGLAEEHAAWKALDGRAAATMPPGGAIAPVTPADRDECLYNPAGQDRKTTAAVDLEVAVGRSPNATANSGVSGFPAFPTLNAGTEVGSFTREYDGAADAVCALDKTVDYCYRGRVADEIQYRPTVLLVERAGHRPVYLGLGAGVYWLFPTVSRASQPGVRTPDQRSLTSRVRFSGRAREDGLDWYKETVARAHLSQPYDRKVDKDKLSLLGRLYRDLSRPASQTLHFWDRGTSPNPDQRYTLALQRPSLQITKPTLHLPGCRFPSLNKLRDDFVSDHPARPWDFEVCGRPCGSDPTFLNVTKTVGTDGNEQLVFDDAFFSVPGNNLDADIPTLADQTGTDPGLVVHKVYLDDGDDNPAVALDAVVPYDTATADGYIHTTDLLFGSNNGILDYADGYPAVTGWQDVEPDDPWTYATLLAGLGLPTPIDTATQILFLLSSGIRDSSKAYRLDGGCLLAGDEPTAGLSTLCSTDPYLDSDGRFDFDPDQAVVIPRMVLTESEVYETTLLDGTIGSLLETL